MKIFSGKIPLTIAPSFWGLACIISWLCSNNIMEFIAWICVVVVSCLVHEMGHALVARLFGQEAEISLGPLGGTTSYGSSTPLSRIKEFCVILFGPLFGLMLAGSALVLYSNLPFGGGFGYFLQALVWANIVWSLFNLLPVHPFDGGKLMSILFEGLFGQTGMRLSYFLSGFFALILAAFFIAKNQIFAGALLLLCAFESLRNWRQRHYFQTTQAEKLYESIEEAQAHWEAKEPQKACQLLESLIKKTKEGEVYEKAVDCLADFLEAMGETTKAYALLHAQRKLQAGSLKLYQVLCYKLGHWQESLETGNKIFREVQEPSCAIMNAFAAAHMHDVKTSINWLTSIKNNKTVDMKSILAAEDFDGIRSDTIFRQFSTNYK